MKYVCVKCISEFDESPKECPVCGCTAFRRVGSASEKPDNEEYESLKDKGLWG